MAEKKTIVAKAKKSNVILFIIVGAAFCGFSWFFIDDSLQHEYPQLVGLVTGILFGLFGLLFIFGIWLLNNYECDGETLFINSIFGSTKKTVSLNEIKSFNEIEKRTKYSTYKDLTIFTDNYKQKISSSSISNYMELKTALTKGKVRDEYSEKIWEYKSYKRTGIILLAIGALFLMALLLVNSNREETILSKDLTTIEGTIAEPLKITSHRSSRWINVHLNEFPNFVFELRGPRFHASRSNEITAEILPGNNVEVDIWTDTYAKKIAKTKELTFREKTMNYNQITVNGLRKGDEIYLDASSIIQAQERNAAGGGNWIVIIVGLGFAGSGIYYLTKKKPAADKNNQQ